MSMSRFTVSREFKLPPREVYERIKDYLNNYKTTYSKYVTEFEHNDNKMEILATIYNIRTTLLVSGKNFGIAHITTEDFPFMYLFLKPKIKSILEEAFDKLENENCVL